ncbi:hypothetical protein [Enterococcus sp. LJL90]
MSILVMLAVGAGVILLVGLFLNSRYHKWQAQELESDNKKLNAALEGVLSHNVEHPLSADWLALFTEKGYSISLIRKIQTVCQIYPNDSYTFRAIKEELNKQLPLEDTSAEVAYTLKKLQDETVQEEIVQDDSVEKLEEVLEFVLHCGVDFPYSTDWLTYFMEKGYSLSQIRKIQTVCLNCQTTPSELRYIGKELEKQLPLGDTSAELSFAVRQLQAEQDKKNVSSRIQADYLLEDICSATVLDRLNGRNPDESEEPKWH